MNQRYFRRVFLLPAAIGTVALLAACEVRTEETDAAGDAAVAAPSPQGEVNRVDSGAADAPEPAAAPIRSVAFAHGSTLDITGMDITGDILTVEFRAHTRENGRGQIVYLDRVNYIEDQTSRKVDVLRDDDGKYIANPSNESGRFISVDTDGGIGWIKFPRPGEGVTTISLTFPEAGALNGLPVPG